MTISTLDAEIRYLLSSTQSDDPSDSGEVVLSDEQVPLRTPLQAVLLSLRQERDRLAESRMAAEVTSAQRIHDLELEWARQRDAKYRQLAELALKRARELVQREFTAETQALKQAKAKLAKEQETLKADRREFEGDREKLRPLETALRTQQEGLVRDREDWEMKCQEQRKQLEGEWQALETVQEELKTSRQDIESAEAEHRVAQQQFEADRNAWANQRQQQLQLLEREQNIVDAARQELEAGRRQLLDAEAILLEAQQDLELKTGNWETEYRQRIQDLKLRQHALDVERQALEADRHQLQPTLDAVREKQQELEWDRNTWEDQRQQQVQIFDRERLAIESQRRELEREWQQLRSAQSELRKLREQFDRDRQAWEDFRLQQAQQLLQDRAEVSDTTQSDESSATASDTQMISRLPSEVDSH